MGGMSVLFMLSASLVEIVASDLGSAAEEVAAVACDCCWNSGWALKISSY